MRSIRSSTQGLVFARSEDTVQAIVRKMAEHALLSVPVLLEKDDPRASDASERWPHVIGKPAVLGFVDVKSLLSRFIEFRRERHKQNEGWKKSIGEDEEDFMDTEETARELEEMAASEQFLNLKVAEVVGKDGLVLSHLQENTNLFQVVQEGFFQCNQNGKRAIHRLAVFNAEGEIFQMVSQSDILRFILRHGMGGIQETMEQDIDSQGLAKKSGLVVVPENLIVIECFAHMIRKDVSGVGVVNGTGALVGNLSASDLRCILPEHFGVLAMPVVEFLSLLYEDADVADISGEGDTSGTHPFFDSSRENVGYKGSPLVTCTAKSSLKEVMQKMCDGHVHRVYVISSSGKPEGVITVTDVLHLFVSKERIFFEGASA